MVVVAQLVEPWIVIPVVVGSSPINHPSYCGRGEIGRRTGFRFQRATVGVRVSPSAPLVILKFSILSIINYLVVLFKKLNKTDYLIQLIIYYLQSCFFIYKV